MTRYAHGYRIRAQAPWETTRSIEEEPGLPVETQEALYRCDKGAGCSHGGQFTQVFAADAPVPDAVNCRCSGVGRRDGAPPGAMPDYSSYSQGVRNNHGPGTGQYKDMRPIALLRERRSDDELEVILRERMTEMGLGGAA